MYKVCFQVRLLWHWLIAAITVHTALAWCKIFRKRNCLHEHSENALPKDNSNNRKLCSQHIKQALETSHCSLASESPGSKVSPPTDVKRKSVVIRQWHINDRSYCINCVIIMKMGWLMVSTILSNDTIILIVQQCNASRLVQEQDLMLSPGIPELSYELHV